MTESTVLFLQKCRLSEQLEQNCLPIAGCFLRLHLGNVLNNLLRAMVKVKFRLLLDGSRSRTLTCVMCLMVCSMACRSPSVAPPASLTSCLACSPSGMRPLRYRLYQASTTAMRMGSSREKMSGHMARSALSAPTSLNCKQHHEITLYILYNQYQYLNTLINFINQHGEEKGKIAQRNLAISSVQLPAKSM